MPPFFIQLRSCASGQPNGSGGERTHIIRYVNPFFGPYGSREGCHPSRRPFPSAAFTPRPDAPRDAIEIRERAVIAICHKQSALPLGEILYFTTYFKRSTGQEVDMTILRRQQQTAVTDLTFTPSGFPWLCCISAVQIPAETSNRFGVPQKRHYITAGACPAVLRFRSCLLWT